MTTRARFPLLLGAAVAAALALGGRTAAGQHAPCDRVATTSIAFGRTAGNIKPEGLLLRADGTLVRDDSSASQLARVATAEVRRLARRGWTGPFARLRPAPTRPTRNPDAARDFVELRSACGSKHVEYVMGQGPLAFRELYNSLTSLASGPPPD
jgi:hypothetical protein